MIFVHGRRFRCRRRRAVTGPCRAAVLARPAVGPGPRMVRNGCVWPGGGTGRAGLEQAVAVARGKAYVILDGTLLRIDRVGMTGGRDRPYYSGKHKCHGLNVQVIADPAGRLIWISPVLPGARHDIDAASEHGIIDAITAAGMRAVADTAYQGGGPRGSDISAGQDRLSGRLRPLTAIGTAFVSRRP
jgi:DDE superfamily endonuclease